MQVDFGCEKLAEANTQRFGGMNQSFVQKVWAKRREHEKKHELEKKRQEAIDAALARAAELKKRKERLEQEKAAREAHKNNALTVDANGIRPSYPLSPTDAANQAIELGFNSIKDAIHIIAALYNVKPDDILGDNRKAIFIMPRHAAICAVKIKWPNASLPYIGKYFGRHHTTILHALRENGVIEGGKK